MALDQAGCEVDAVCPRRHPLTQTSAVGRVHGYSGFSPLASFARALSASQPDLIVSGDDLTTQHLQRLYRRENSRRANERTPQAAAHSSSSPLCELIERSFGSPESFPVVSARTAFMNLAQAEGLRVPATEVVESLASLKKWIARSGLPAVLKANGTSGGDGVRVVHTAEEAEQAFERLQAPPLLARAVKRALLDRDTTLLWPSLTRRRSVVNAQAFIAGREATSALFCWQGKVLASHHFEVMQKASAAGHATVLRQVEHPEMSAAAEAMARRLRLSGFYGLDFMLEAETGCAFLIEINPRATQVGHLSLGAGRDIPAALYQTLCAREALLASPPNPPSDLRPARQVRKVTENDTIALFPQEWIRDPESAYLRSAYHDVPWEEPDLVRDCVRQRKKQSAWYTRSSRKSVEAIAQPRPANPSFGERSVGASAEAGSVEFGGK
jgi:hypothetical protein